MEYFIYITNDCNLNCDYCSVLIDCQTNRLPVKPAYTFEQICSFIKSVQNIESDDVAIIYFFGGEPTLEFVYICDFISYFNVHMRNVAIKYVLHTNGLLLNQMPDALANSFSLIMHSINYERIPKHHLRDSYFSQILQGLRSFRNRSSSPVIARLTITEKTSLYTEVMQIAHFYDLVYWQIENCIEFADFKSFYNTYTYEVELLFEYWMAFFREGTFLHFVPFVAVVKFLLEHDRNDLEFSCGYGRGMIYIQTNGACYACSDSVESKTHLMGNINDGIEFSRPSLCDYKCKDCSYRFICMGRCGRMHKEFSKRHIEEYCALNQAMFRLFLDNRQDIINIYNANPHYSKVVNSDLLNFTEFTP